MILGLPRDEYRRLARYFAIDVGNLPVWIRDHRWPAGVGLLADVDIERQRAEERHVVVLAHLLAAALAEDVLDMPAVRADVDRHVLDDADDRHAHLLEHL